jgi:hypothetical protein
MQQTILHDPYAGVTPTMRREATLRQERLERLHKARVSKPPAVKPTPAPPAIAARPAPVSETWEQRQLRRFAKPLWFSIEGEIEPTEPRRPRVEVIQAIVAKHYGITRHDMISARRTAPIVKPRMIATYLAKQLTLKSLPEIGRRFGNRDHSTVLHSVRKIGHLYERDAALKADIDAIKTVIVGAQL